MIDILSNIYAKNFKNDKNKYDQIMKNFEFVDSFMRRYNYKITSNKAIKSENKVHIEFDIVEFEDKYNSLYGFIDLTLNGIYVEVDKVFFDSSFCIFEYLTINNDYLEGTMCDYVYYNSEVAIIKNSMKQNYIGRSCCTFFDKDGIKEEKDNSINIPYNSNEVDKMVEEIMEMHELNQEAIADEINIDNYNIKTLTFNMDCQDMDFPDFENKIKSKRRRRKK